MYFSGAATASWWRIAKPCKAGEVVRSFTPALIAVAVFCFLWSHQFIPLSLPSDFFVSKDHVGVLRFANFYAFMLVICWVVRRFPDLLDFRMTNTMGRHSLDVYTAQIVLVYIWMALPGSIRYHGPWNVLVPLSSCVLLWALAKLREPRVK